LEERVNQINLYLNEECNNLSLTPINSAKKIIGNNKKQIYFSSFTQGNNIKNRFF
jgi:hypothetical protein